MRNAPHILNAATTLLATPPGGWGETAQAERAWQEAALAGWSDAGRPLYLTPAGRRGRRELARLRWLQVARRSGAWVHPDRDDGDL